MRHVQTTRATLAITAVFTAAAIVFAAGGPTVAEDGAAHFENRCAQCHDAGSIAAWAEAHPDAEERAEWLADLLESHFPPPEEERPAIIEHIQQVIAETGG